ncbi:putative GAF-like domain superfamily protein [Helianthus annuus]|nr:putative GAF-like domain superfamily protein [Helianthus annuus]
MLQATYSCFVVVVLEEKPSLDASCVNIPVHIDGEVKKKIISTLQNLPFRDGESVIVLFWAAEEIKKYIFVLTTTFQPFLLSGNNKELHAYRLSCLYNKLYVYRGAKEEAAFGLAGMAYLYCTPQQTQNVHEYLRDHSPTCEHASFTKKWGSYAVPVIDANKCVGVLEVITDTPRDYSNDITVAKEVLEVRRALYNLHYILINKLVVLSFHIQIIFVYYLLC